MRVSQVEKMAPCGGDGTASPPAADACTVLCVLAIFILHVSPSLVTLMFLADLVP